MPSLVIVAVCRQRSLSVLVDVSSLRSARSLPSLFFAGVHTCAERIFMVVCIFVVLRTNKYKISKLAFCLRVKKLRECKITAKKAATDRLKGLKLAFSLTNPKMLPNARIDGKMRALADRRRFELRFYVHRFGDKGETST